jgi:hypothetical protein
MNTRQSGDLPARLEGVRRRFERWRQTHTPPSRIPDSLWARAVKMAATYGLHQTARTLRLDYYTLRKHVTENEVAHAEPSEKGAAATFLELSPPAPSASCECTLELEDASGAKMRVQVKGMAMPDLAAISQSFWNRRP